MDLGLPLLAGWYQRRRLNWEQTWKSTKHNNHLTGFSLIHSIQRHWLNAYHVPARTGKIKEISYYPCPLNPPILFSRKLPIPEDFLCKDSRNSIHSLPRKDDWYVFMLGYENNLHLWENQGHPSTIPSRRYWNTEALISLNNSSQHEVRDLDTKERDPKPWKAGVKMCSVVPRKTGYVLFSWTQT